ncbi:MAG: hypothetical protein N2B03_03350, partial [Boseongicola sp.]
GADDIVRELFDSSLRAGRYVLENMGLTDTEATKIEHFFYRKDREGMRELAELWKPDVPVGDNAAYVERAKELNAEIETALVSHLDETYVPIPSDQIVADEAQDIAGVQETPEQDAIDPSK